MKRFLALLIALSVFIPQAFSQTAAQKNRKARLEKEIAILDKQLSENRKRSSTAESSLKLTRKKMDSRKQLVAESDRQIKELDGRIAAKDGQIVNAHLGRAIRFEE